MRITRYCETGWAVATTSSKGDPTATLRSLQPFDYGIVKSGAKLFDRLVGAVGPGAVGEQRDRELAVRIDPEGRAGVAEVAIGLRPEVSSRLRRRRWGVPAERAGCAGGAGFAASEDRDRFGAEDG